MTNLGAKGAKRSVKMWTTNFYRSFWKNILLYMSSRLSKIRSEHTYVMPRTVYFGWICTRWEFRPFPAFVSRVLHPNAKNHSESDCLTFFIHEIFHLDARAVKQIRGCKTISILIVVYFSFDLISWFLYKTETFIDIT